MSMLTASVGDGAKIAYRFDGPAEAPLVVLASSLGATHAMWDRVVPALAKHHRVLRYDARGHGASTIVPGPYSIDRLGRDVIDLLDALAIRRAAFCGLSIGGMVGQWLGARHPDRITRLALLHTAAVLGPPAGWQARITEVLDGGTVAPLVSATMSRWFTPGFAAREPDVVAMARAMVLACDPVGYAGGCAAVRDMDQRPSARAITVPTLVLVGTDDPSTTTADGEWLRDNIPGARLEALPTAHVSALEAPAEVARILLSFLAG